jgi:hypothetical protein
MKQTAVEWLFSQLPDHLRLSEDGFDTLQQAKTMEAEQKKEAYNEGMIQGIKFAVNEEWGEEEGGAK